MDMGNGTAGMSGHEHGASGSHPPGSHLSFMCDGAHWSGMGPQRPSNWSTHVAPGAFVLLWAAHWTLGVFQAWLRSSKHLPYQAQTTYTMPFVPYAIPVEAVLKVLFPLVGILTQLWWANGHWTSNTCPEGSTRAGHFAIVAVHNWQNAWTLAGFLLAGLVDLVAPRVTLPPNLQHTTTAAAFALQAFALYQGQHQDMLDDMLYFVFAMVVAATSAAMFIEILSPDAFWVGCVKVYTLWLQGIWYCTAAHVLFEGRAAWDTLNPVPDMSPEMYLPVVFVMWMNITALALLLVFLVLRRWYNAHLNEHLRALGRVERVLLPKPTDGQAARVAAAGPGIKVNEMTPLVMRA